MREEARVVREEARVVAEEARVVAGARGNPVGAGVPGTARHGPTSRRTSPLSRQTGLLGRQVSPLGRRVSPLGRRVSPLGRKMSLLGRQVSPLGGTASEVGASRCDDPVERGAVQGGSLAADLVGGEPQQPVQAHLARTALGVPGAGADVHPQPAGTSLLLGVTVVVLRGQLEGEQVGPLPTDDEHGAVLALGGVLLVGDPGPAHLAGVRATVGPGRPAELAGRA